MKPKTKSICFQTVFTLVIIASGVGIGYTNFVQTEIKEDLVEMKIDSDINSEKINSVQIQLADIRGDIKLLIERSKP